MDVNNVPDRYLALKSWRLVHIDVICVSISLIHVAQRVLLHVIASIYVSIEHSIKNGSVYHLMVVADNGAIDTFRPRKMATVLLTTIQINFLELQLLRLVPISLFFFPLTQLKIICHWLR